MARGGYRANAGRKSLTEEQKLARVLAKCLEVTIEFISSDAPLRERADVAVKLVSKSIKQSVELSGVNGQAIEVINYAREDASRRDSLRAAGISAGN